MSAYLNYSFEDNAQFVATYDELPLWSAAFGMLLLKHINYTPGSTIVDIGSGTGFPLIELASRFGPASQCYGVDTWSNANERATQKTKNYSLDNVALLSCSGADIPLADDSTDLIVSNLGINNFEAPAAVFAECKRLLKPNGKLALTTNLYGHWREFYRVFEATLFELDMEALAEEIKTHEQARGTVESVSAYFEGAGLPVSRCITDSFEMKFADGTAFLNHHFVKLGWLTTWLQLVPKEHQQKVFTRLEVNLNKLANEHNGLSLTVPMAFVEGVKPE